MLELYNNPDFLQYLYEIEHLDEVYPSRDKWTRDLDTIGRFAQMETTTLGKVELIHPESVLTHAIRVNSLTFLMGASLAKQGIPINTFKLSRMSLHHDDAEVDPEIGDIPTPIKRQMSPEELLALRAQEAAASQRLADLYTVEQYKEVYLADAEEVAAKTSIEAQLVTICDKWDGICKVILEIQCGNTDLEEIFRNYQNEMMLLKKLPVFNLVATADFDIHRDLPFELIRNMPKLSRELLVQNPREFWRILFETELPSNLYRTWLDQTMRLVDPRRTFTGWREETTQYFLPLLAAYRQGTLT